jgi:prepilin-type N-terminal cleavage/methylation domain-containing protein
VRKQRGFTLLEVLAAVAILGMALAVIMQLFSANLRGITASDDYLAASIAAEAKMREIIDRGDYHEQEWTETTEEGYQVNVSVRPALEERTESLPVQLHEIALSLRFEKGGKARTITLRTLKTAGRAI